MKQESMASVRSIQWVAARRIPYSSKLLSDELWKSTLAESSNIKQVVFLKKNFEAQGVNVEKCLRTRVILLGATKG